MTSSASASACARQLFSNWFAEEHAPGAFYTVSSPDGILAEGGYGRYDDHGNRPHHDTAFRIASCTKSFTAAAILMLRDRGLLNLDDNLSDFVPELVATPRAEDQPSLTLRMLLTMAGGLGTDDAWADRQESLSNAEFRNMLAAGIRFVSTPGTRFEYSNLGYALLGQVIEAVTNTPFRQVIHSELLGPLALTSTGFDDDVPARGGTAVGFRRGANRWQPEPVTRPGAFSPIGGIFSTAADLSRWAQWLSAGFSESADDTTVLSPASRREMQQAHRLTGSTNSPPTAPTPGTQGYGYGLVVHLHPRHGPIISHSGGYPGFGSHMRWHPGSGLATIALANATYANIAQPAARTLERLLEEHLSDGPRFQLEELWPETHAARSDVETLVKKWDDGLAARILADNARLDEPLERRREQLAAVLEETGPVTASSCSITDNSSSSSPAHLRWSIPAERGTLKCEIRMHPLNPPKIQMLRFSAHPQTAAAC
ncbi:serine hydrolase domain-containing protein [Arthrobacter pigmenti]